MAENQILLLPRMDYYKWVRAAQKFALHFGVTITPDPIKAGNHQIITVVISQNSYPHERDIVEWLNLRFPENNIDPVFVENPEGLAKALDHRIDHGVRYGRMTGHEAGLDVLPKYPKDRFYLFWPTDYHSIIQPFGANPEIYTQYGLRGHEGVDIRAPFGANVYACGAGEVYLVNEDSTLHNYGKQIRIQHDKGYRTTYALLERVLVKEGDQVRARQLIGRAGSTGSASGQYLHLTLKKDQATANGETDFPGDIIDPTPFLVYQHQEAEVFEALGVNGGGRTFHHFPWARPCLVGLVSRIGGSMQEVDYSVIEQARIEAVRIHAKTASLTLTRLKELVPDIFIVARMSVPSSKDPMSPKKWLEGMRLDIDRLYRLGVRYFEIHQSPNLQQYGWRSSWYSGEHFGKWWLAVAEKLWVEFSGVKLGFPGVSPGKQVPGLRMDANVFLDGADLAMSKADWLGVNCFWTNEMEMNHADYGKFYEELQERFPEKLLFITEFGNVNQSTPPNIKGEEYVRYYQRLREIKGIGAAFSQVVSASKGYEDLVWRNEAGETTQIVESVGGRQF